MNAIGRNSLCNLIGTILPLALFIVTIPAYISLIGAGIGVQSRAKFGPFEKEPEFAGNCLHLPPAKAAAIRRFAIACAEEKK